MNTVFSCLAGVARGSSFTPLWQPPFLTRLAAEDACQLNAIPLARAALAPGQDAMERLLRRHLGVHLQAIGQLRLSRTLG